jgi:hypothetical protein
VRKGALFPTKKQRQDCWALRCPNRLANGSEQMKLGRLFGNQRALKAG